MLPSLKTNMKEASQKTQPKTVQCLTISGGCDGFSVAGAHRQHQKSRGDCTQISITAWTPAHVWEHPSFPGWAHAQAECAVSYATGVSGRGKSSFKMECLQVGQVWNFLFSPYENLSDYCLFVLSLLEHEPHGNSEEHPRGSAFQFSSLNEVGTSFPGRIQTGEQASLWPDCFWKCY